MDTMSSASQAALDVRSRELSHWIEPAVAFASLVHTPGSVLLESQRGSVGGRYSIICTEPIGTLITSAGRTEMNLPFEVIESYQSPFDCLRRILSMAPVSPGPDTPFYGGIVGYIGYELLTFLEPVRISSRDDLHVPDCLIGVYDCAAVFDHQRKKICLNAVGIPGVTGVESRLATLEDATLRTESGEVTIAQEQIAVSEPELISSFTKEEYRRAIRTVREYIAAGDIYQANIAQRFSATVAADPWQIYLRLRDRNPAPYAAYLSCGGFDIVSSSPECFLAYNPIDRTVETRPIKGTRPRSVDAEEDRGLAAALAGSEKDIAENVMIVDLERNDLGRVCEYGSVRVTELAEVESHPTVHHLVSTVTGKLRQECDPVDLLVACFPGGSITGAPKVRAMEIIDEVEPVRRGVYTGSIGYFGFDGSVNLNIAIRTAVVRDRICHFHAGGGIVADSDPDMEYQETLDKARAFFEVLRCTKILTR